MQLKKQGRTPIYENALKVAVAREYLTSNSSYRFLAKKYDLPGPKTVNGFVRWYKKTSSVKPDAPVKDTGSVPDNSNENQISKQLKEANLKIAGLEMLIATAQKELGIDIIKKPGTKQS